jgi:hypothetical protein
MEDLYLYKLTEYLPVCHISKGLQAFQQQDLSTGPKSINRVLRSAF